MIMAIIRTTLCICFTGLLAACGNESATQSAAETSTNLTLQTVASHLNSPVFLTTPPGDQTRLFVAEQGGVIKVLDRNTGNLLATFLTLTDMSNGAERGLLGFAFDPNYHVNGRFFVHYTDANGTITIARFLRSATNPQIADPASQVILVSIPHPTFQPQRGHVGVRTRWMSVCWSR
jgi:hypothetical protein